MDKRIPDHVYVDGFRRVKLCERVNAVVLLWLVVECALACPQQVKR